MRAMNRRIALLSTASIIVSPRLVGAATQTTQSEGLLPSPGLPPQDAQPHPSLYWETGVEEGFTNLRFQIRKEFVLIVGGTDINGRGGGVYIASNFEHDSTVTIEQLQNGFFLLVRDDWARNEFRFRLEQTGVYNWARGHVFVPSSWMDEFNDFNPSPVTDL